MTNVKEYNWEIFNDDSFDGPEALSEDDPGASAYLCLQLKKRRDIEREILSTVWDFEPNMPPSIYVEMLSYKLTALRLFQDMNNRMTNISLHQLFCIEESIANEISRRREKEEFQKTSDEIAASKEKLRRNQKSKLSDKAACFAPLSKQKKVAASKEKLGRNQKSKLSDKADCFAPLSKQKKDSVMQKKKKRLPVNLKNIQKSQVSKKDAGPISPVRLLRSSSIKSKRSAENTLKKVNLINNQKSQVPPKDAGSISAIRLLRASSIKSKRSAANTLKKVNLINNQKSQVPQKDAGSISAIRSLRSSSIKSQR